MVADRAGVKGGIVAYYHVAGDTYLSAFSTGNMDYRAVLHADPVTDLDGIHVSPDYGTVPDRTVTADLNIAENCRRLGYERPFADLRRLSLYCPYDHGTMLRRNVCASAIDKDNIIIIFAKKTEMEIMEITETTAIIRLAFSILFGGLIGIERMIHKHPAGLRTFTLICLASTLATLASIYICQANMDLHNGDPARLAAQILTGIGFIGAGLIIKTNDGVSGLTTATCIFMTAVIGVATGVGMILTSGFVTVATCLILWSGNYIHKK